MISQKLKDQWKTKALERLEAQYGEDFCPPKRSVTLVIKSMTNDLDITDDDFYGDIAAAHFRDVSGPLVKKGDSTSRIAEQLMLTYEKDMKPV